MTSTPRPRDFFETRDGLLFAVLVPFVDESGVAGTLRYRRTDAGLRKLDRAAAATELASRHPDWLRHSPRLDIELPIVPTEAIARWHRADEGLARLRAEMPRSRAHERLLVACERLAAHGAELAALGVTGSVLVGAEHPESDLDLVAFGRAAFQRARSALAAGVSAGDFAALDDEAWRDAWARRAPAIGLADYAWHERRKGTKASVGGTRLDLTCVPLPGELAPDPGPVRKLGRERVRARVADDAAAFDHPARLVLAGSPVREIVIFTATYVGQARAGEEVEAVGWLEEDAAGVRRLLVGTSREAEGEWVRVLR